MTDHRPVNCRFRLKDEGKLYKPTVCDVCHRTTMTMGTACDIPKAAAATRTPPALGYHSNTAMRLDKMGKGYIPTFLYHKFAVNGITAEQAREAAHLLNQLAEFLEWQEKQR